MRTLRLRTCAVVGWMAFGTVIVCRAEQALPPQEAVLDGLRQGHPRLLATGADFQRLKAVCGPSAPAGQWFARLRGDAEELLQTPPVKYEIPDGKRLLSVSRRAKERVLLLALIYRLTEDRRFADRLWEELDTVSRFKDWNPSHFLDTAEMTFAVAIGDDWLHDVWNESQHAQLLQAIFELGLTPGVSIYRQQTSWSRAIHNWNQVCNGGMGIGALAIADERPEIAAEVLHAALQSLPLAMHEFRPDGGWGEGPGYWRYATEYNVYFLAALRTALGTDFGLAESPGFPVTGDFPGHFVGPTGLSFNYADAHDSWQGAPQLFWLATAFEQPAYAAAQMPHASSRLSALNLLWGARWLVEPPQAGAIPLDRHFEGVSVVTMRSAWNDPQAVFVGFKGGNNRVNHGQLDLGTFVLDAFGVRWAIDLGPDDYNLPGYFGNNRWSYYRNRTEGHNTLVIDGQNQSTSARAAITRFCSTDRQSSAVADLSAAYPNTKRAQRGIALLERKQVLLQDEIEADQPIDAVWNLHTTAAVSIASHRAALTRDGRQMNLEILAPPDGRWTVNEVSTTPPQRPIRDVRRLSVVLPKPATAVRLVVLFTPGEEVVGRTPAIRPLDQWPNEK